MPIRVGMQFLPLTSVQKRTSSMGVSSVAVWHIQSYTLPQQSLIISNFNFQNLQFVFVYRIQDGN